MTGDLNIFHWKIISNGPKSGNHNLIIKDSVEEEFEDIKGVFRIHKSKKDRQHNDQKKKDKGTNNDLQNTTEKN